MKSLRFAVIATLTFLAVLTGPPAATAAEALVPRSTGQTVYVPVYSHVYSGDKALPFNLAVMLSIRNTDPRNALRVLAIEYYDNDGKLLEKHLAKPLPLGPLASHHVFIKESDEAGGFGANFLVRWEADKEINPPVIESVMIGARSGQGISFLSRGQVIEERAR
jgi:hypothetical protein